MPPRKRAASAPKAESEQEPVTPETEGDGQQAELSHDSAPASDDSTTPADDNADQTPASPDNDDGQTPDADDEDEPERSDLQAVDQPHEECFPNGWPEGAFSVGCTHGTWVRKQD